MNVLYLLRKQERETHPKPKKHSIINTKNNYLKGVKNNHKEAVIPAGTEQNSRHKETTPRSNEIHTCTTNNT
jgi:hypothetical protein